MGLVKCPDCRKMVSERVSSCPECGCPSEYFNTVIENEQPAVNDDYKVEIEDETFAEFMFLGRTIKYYKSEEIFVNMIKLHNDTAANVERELRKQYKAVNNIDKVWDDVIPSANYAISKLVKENLGLLYKAGINMSEKQFMKKHKVDLLGYIQPMIDAYDELMEAAGNLQRAREIERNSRSRWQGGGFGLKGAIKGAVTAGALNAVTGAGRAIGDSMVNSGDNAKIQEAKQSIYNNENYQEKIFFGFRMCIARADIGLAQDLAEAGITDYLDIDYVEAAQGYVMAGEYEKNDAKFAQKAIDAIEKYPLSPEFYRPLIKEAIISRDEDIDQVLDFMEFWNMKGDFQELFVSAQKRIPIMAYIKEHPEIKSIDFGKYDVSTYVQIRDLKLAFEKITGDKDLCPLVTTCLKVSNYFEKCLNKAHVLDSVEVLGDLNENDSAEEFLKKVHNEKVVLPGLLKNIWVLGDSDSIPEKKLKSKWNITESDTIYMYQNKAIFGTAFGGDGFVLTENVLCDLNSKLCIRLNQITNIKYDKKSKILITDGNKEICIDLSDERPATKLFFYDCLEEFVSRYAELTEEEKHQRAVYRAAERIQRIIAEYAKVNNIDDTDKLLREFLTEQGILEKKSANIFCSSCGKQILRTAKFCNFCGAVNHYGK